MIKRKAQTGQYVRTSLCFIEIVASAAQHDLVAVDLAFVRGRLAAQVLLALEYLHTVHAVIYRDLKPENVLLALDGHAVLADFGSARGLTSTSRIGSRTIVGTPVYMAPEIVKGTG